MLVAPLLGIDSISAPDQEGREIELPVERSIEPHL